MVLIRRCAAGLLVAAGALGLASTTVGQPPRGAKELRVVGAPQVTPGQARLEAMKVELAWLADMATYGMPLEVHVEAEGLCARGRVPDDAARQQVLEVARQASCLPVADRLTIATAAPTGTAEPRALEASARAALAKHLGDLAGAVKVRVGGEGRVTLSGEVATVEDKLAASRCLKGLSGCAAVTNALAVTPVRHAGHTVTVVTRDGQHTVHGAVQLTGAEKPAAPSAPADEAPPAAQATTVPYILPPTPATTLPSGLPAQQRMHVQVIRGGNSTYENRPIRYILPSRSAATAGHPGCEGKCEEMHGQAVQQSSRPSLWERLTSFTRPRREPEVMGDGMVITPMKATTEPPVVQPAAKETVWPRAHATAPADEPAAAPKKPQPVSRPLSHLKRVGDRPAVKPEPPRGTFADGQPLPPIGQSVPPAPAPELKPVVQLERVAQGRSPEEIMEVVRGHCGKLARDVRVEVYKDGSTVVKVHASSANEGALVGKLLGLPALGEKVKVQVVLGR